MGHPAMRQKDPGFIPFTFMNRILGGSPVGDDRLFREIREKQGLAYAVGSFVSGGQRWRSQLELALLSFMAFLRTITRPTLSECKR